MPPTDPTGPWPEQQVLLTHLAAWMSERRWFPLKDGQPPDGAALRVVADSRLAPGVRDLVVAVPRTDHSPVLMHVPLVLDSPGALERLTGAGEAPGAAGFALPDGTALVDGPHHPSFWRAWARAALAAGTTLRPEATTAVVQRAERLRVTTGEQSNTSVILPAPSGADDAAGAEDAATEGLIIKLFRVLAPGRNPDVEVSVALARDGWDRVPAPVAWSTVQLPGTLEPGGAASEDAAPRDAASEAADGAVASVLVDQATDGFNLFCSLAGSDDGPGSPVRERAVALARDLGATTAQMHAHLASALGTYEPVSPRALEAELRRRARWALAEVPSLGAEVPGLQAAVDALYARLGSLDHLPASTRVHGDDHLGQVLYCEPQGRWYVLDFEGEPLRPLAQRSDPDLPARDVAGMLRSFDYAAAVGKAPHPDWLPAVRSAFEEGYRLGRQETGSLAPSPAASGDQEQAEASYQTVLTCLELDKALYEAVYEARNRPDWLGIPMAGIESVLSKHAEG